MGKPTSFWQERYLRAKIESLALRGEIERVELFVGEAKQAIKKYCKFRQGKAKLNFAQFLSLGDERSPRRIAKLNAHLAKCKKLLASVDQRREYMKSFLSTEQVNELDLKAIQIENKMWCMNVPKKFPTLSVPKKLFTVPFDQARVEVESNGNEKVGRIKSSLPEK